MKYDRFLAFSILSSQQRELFNRFLSPANESSLFKDVPLSLLEEMRSIAHKIKLSNQRVNTKYRGPRYDWQRSTCRKADARAAAIYLHQNWNN
jgi:hypothetical protein